MVWLGFIAGTEFFVAYQSEGPFRELLAISLLMAIVIAVVPDEPGLPDGQPQRRGTPPGHAGEADDIAGADCQAVHQNLASKSARGGRK